MTEAEKHLYLDGDNGLKPYLRMVGKGMPQGKIRKIAWLLLNGGGCGFCKVCRDEPCNIKEGESCTSNIENYIRETVIKEYEQEIRAKAIDDFAEAVKTSPLVHEWCCNDTPMELCDTDCDKCTHKFKKKIDKIAERVKEKSNA